MGASTDVFASDLARAVDAELQSRFPSVDAGEEEAYRSDEVEAVGWPALQQRATAVLGAGGAPQLGGVEAYQAVYVPAALPKIEHVPIANAADPLQIGSLDALLEELRRFADKASLPTDDVELMQLAAHYLESDELYDQDLDVQTYVQLMLSSKQASARGQALWVVV